MRIRCAWLMVVTVLTVASAHAEERALRVGVLPYLTTNVLITLFQPLRTHLEQKLGRPVELYTAPDVPTFVRRTLDSSYDLTVISPHHARLIQIDAGHIPLVRFSGPLQAAVAVRSESPLRDVSELRGRRVTVSDRSFLTNIVTMRRLASMRIGEKDLRLTTVSSQNNALMAMARGDADAAIITRFVLNQIPLAQREGFRLIYTSEALPNLVLIARPGLPQGEREALRQVLLTLPTTPDGRAFLQKSRFQGIQDVTPVFMRQLDSYLPETRRQLYP